MMRVAAVVNVHVEVALGPRRERREEFFRQLAIEVTDPFTVETSDLPDECRPATEVDGDRDEHLVHGKRRGSVANDAGALPECLFERIAEHEPDVLDRVVRIDLDVTGRGQLEIVESVARKGVHHVAEERDRRRDRAGATAVEIQSDADLGLLRVALELDATCHSFLYQPPCDRTTSGMRGYVLVGLTGLAITACGGGGDKKTLKKPSTDGDESSSSSKPETEEDREAKRRKAAQKIVPDGATCLPVALREEEAPRLDLAAVGADAIVCAVDVSPERMLGPVGCWKVDLASGALAYKDPEPLPGRGFISRLEKGCTRGFCLPKDAKPSAKVAQIAWDLESKKVAMLVDNDVHLFDAETKAHESTFSAVGDKGISGKATNLHFVGSTVVIEAANEGAGSGVWVFKTDGTQQGPVLALGGKDEKPLSPHKGSVSILDKARIAVSERGMETLTTYEVETGKRAKLVRTAKKPACKPAEIDAFWKDGDKVGDKCKGSIEALSGHLIGATAVAGAKNFLVMLRGDRLGELGVLDAKTLAEKKSIKMPWCTDDAGGGSDKDAAAKGEAESAPKKSTRGAKTSSDPEEGGE